MSFACNLAWSDGPKTLFFEKKKYKKRYLYKREKENDLWLKKSISLISQMGDLASEAKTFPWTVWRKKVEFSHGTFNGFLALDSVKSIKMPFNFSFLKISCQIHLEPKFAKMTLSSAQKLNSQAKSHLKPSHLKHRVSV